MSEAGQQQKSKLSLTLPQQRRYDMVTPQKGFKTGSSVCGMQLLRTSIAFF